MSSHESFPSRELDRKWYLISLTCSILLGPEFPRKFPATFGQIWKRSSQDSTFSAISDTRPIFSCWPRGKSNLISPLWPLCGTPYWRPCTMNRPPDDTFDRYEKFVSQKFSFLRGRDACRMLTMLSKFLNSKLPYTSEINFFPVSLHSSSSMYPDSFLPSLKRSKISFSVSFRQKNSSGLVRLTSFTNFWKMDATGFDPRDLCTYV